MDRSRTDNGSVGAAAVCSSRQGWTLFRSYLCTGRMEVFDDQLLSIGVALRTSASKAEALRAHGVPTVVVLSDSRVAMRWTAQLDPGPGQQLERAINEHARGSVPGASMPRATGAQDTRASPGTKMLDGEQTMHEKIEISQYTSEYHPRL